MTTRDLSSNQFARCRCILFSSLLLISDPTSCKCKWSASPPLKPLKSHLQKWVTKWTADRCESEGYYSPVSKSGRMKPKRSEVDWFSSSPFYHDIFACDYADNGRVSLSLLEGVHQSNRWFIKSITETEEEEEVKKWEWKVWIYLFSNTSEESFVQWDGEMMSRCWWRWERERETRSPSFIWFASG